MMLLNDYTRCLGRGCVLRNKCARHTARVEEDVSYSWVGGPYPEGDGTNCLHYIFDADAYPST